MTRGFIIIYIDCFSTCHQKLRVKQLWDRVIHVIEGQKVPVPGPLAVVWLLLLDDHKLAQKLIHIISGSSVKPTTALMIFPSKRNCKPIGCRKQLPAKTNDHCTFELVPKSHALLTFHNKTYIDNTFENNTLYDLSSVERPWMK